MRQIGENMKKVLACILAILDIAILIVIINAIRTEHLAEKEIDNTETVSDFRPEEESDEEEPHSENTVDDYLLQGTVFPDEEELNSDEVDQGEPTPVIKYDPSVYSTDGVPTLEDFSWVTNDLYENGVMGDVDRLSANEVTGGWRTYIIADTEESHGSMSEYFLTTYIEGTEDDLSVRLDWLYVYITNEGEGHDDETDDTVLSGRWNGKGIEAAGAISLELTDFYYEDGKEYGVGKLHSESAPDCSVYLVRP